MKLARIRALRGVVNVPADKSISHRAIIISSIAEGDSMIRNALISADTLASADIFSCLGVDIIRSDEGLRIMGKGLRGLKKPHKYLDAKNSGTSMRMISGILSAMDFDSVIIGDESLSKRPMKRIIEPLEMMGAHIDSENFHAPLAIRASKTPLKSIDYISQVASAQVKSAVLFAGLYADGCTSFTEPYLSREHSENMLSFYGAKIIRTNTSDDFSANAYDVLRTGAKVGIYPSERLEAREVVVPADISSAAYFLVASQIIKGSKIVIKDVLLNETRTGIIDALLMMGADIKLENIRMQAGEKIGDIVSAYSELSAVKISGELTLRLIDEVPILVIAALFADDTSVIRDASELRLKESDRLGAMASELSKLGCDIEELEDGLVIHPINKVKNGLKSARLDSHNDHRIAMALSVLAAALDEDIWLDNSEVVAVSYPDFYNDLYKYL